jgi:hypothetical protein
MTPNEALAAADIAREAGRLVARPGGWGQCSDGGASSTLADGGCAYVVLGAATSDWDNGAGNIVLAEAIRLVSSAALTGLFEWNDAPERRQHEVVELFESIAKHFDREAARIAEKGTR